MLLCTWNQPSQSLITWRKRSSFSGVNHRKQNASSTFSIWWGRREPIGHSVPLVTYENLTANHQNRAVKGQQTYLWCRSTPYTPSSPLHKKYEKKIRNATIQKLIESKKLQHENWHEWLIDMISSLVWDSSNGILTNKKKWQGKK